ncbi:ABC transporter substrate-binding protein [Maritimibacter alkaliphilus]|uniref:ABC transporter substrate-binding protein n=1 Tax=Maritimibacter alkaliphilus TaxID=404236 RepID=UPI001C966CD5|nr:ABC transporter substrate-binding protein [Maritimibacter alkaliphilus]MBY6088749.1 ABC transporter substrate-binding protein [Maritimibacter alkaliphilus]
MLKHLLGAACLLALSSLTPARADQGITDTTVTFAQVAAFDGPAAALGQGMRTGIEAAFAEANRGGGVHGRTLVLDTVDDGYEPDRSMAEVRGIIAGDAHIGLIGPVGTPTSQATQPLATAAGLPFIGPFTGAGFLRDPALTNVINIRATYGAETAVWIDHLVGGLGLERIAILYQDDGFGRVGLEGVTAAMDARGMSLVAQGTYTRNTVAVKTALLEIRKAEPQAVVMVGAYKPIAEFIRLSHKMKMDPVFVNISFVGSDALAVDLGAEGEGVIISQVVPFPWDASLPLVADYQTALTASDASAAPGFVSLEGYITGRVAIEALRAAGPELTRATYLSALASLGTLDLGGFTLTYGAGDNQGSEVVFLTQINADGSFTPVPVGQGG